MSRRNLVCSAALLALGWMLGSIEWNQSAAAQDANAPAAFFQVYKDKGGDFRWKLFSAEKKVIAASGIDYTDKQACLTDLEFLRKNAGTAKVNDISDAAK